VQTAATPERARLRSDALGIAREERSLADVVQPQEEHHHALQTNAAARMRQRAVLEGVDIALQLRHGDAERLDALLEHVRVVHALRAADDLLPAQEHVVAVGDGGVGGVHHRVEGPQLGGVLVHDEEVRAVALAHDGAEGLFLRGGEVVAPRHLHARVSLEQREALRVGDAEGGAVEEEVLEGVLRAHRLQLALEARVEALEDGDEEVGEEVQGLVVVLVDGHLQVQAVELAKVAVRVAVLGAEHGADLKHALHVGARGRHLLEQLRGLGEASVLPEVLEAEDGAAALARAAQQLGALDLHEVTLQQELAEEGAHAAGDAHDGSVGGGAEVDPPVVQAQVLRGARVGRG